MVLVHLYFHQILKSKACTSTYSVNSTVTATSEMRAEKKWCGGSEPFDHKFAGLNLNGFFIREM